MADPKISNLSFIEKEICDKLKGTNVTEIKETEYDQMIIDGMEEFKKYVTREFSTHPQFKKYFDMIQWKGYMHFKLAMELILIPQQFNIKNFAYSMAKENGLILSVKHLDDLETFAMFFIGMCK